MSSEDFLRIDPTKLEEDIDEIAIQKTCDAFQQIDKFFEQNSGSDFTIEDDPYQENSLVASFYGKKGTQHEGAVYLVQIIISSEYPEEEPSCKFVGMIPYHSNVNSNGGICMGYLTNWRKNNNILNLLFKLDNFLYTPDQENGYQRCQLFNGDGHLIDSNYSACRDWAKQTRKENSVQKVFK